MTRNKLEKFKQKTLFRIEMAVFLLITIFVSIISSVDSINNNKSVEESAKSYEMNSALALTEGYENIHLQRNETPEALEHRSLDDEYEYSDDQKSEFMEIEHRSLDEMEHRSISGDEIKISPVFKPRLEYNSWQPVGRGDPLKNDPTYDYSPPVVEPVRYWAENNKNENPANSLTNQKELALRRDKNEILLLGVPAKRQNYRKDTKYNSNNHFKTSSADLPNQYYGQENQYQQNPDIQGTIRRSYSYGHYHNLPTRLMPPPMQTIAPQSSVSGVIKMMPTTESIHHTYHHHYPGMPSTMMTYTTSKINPQNSNSNPNGYFQYTGTMPGSNPVPPPPGWTYNKKPFDTRNSESVNYVSFSKPKINAIESIPTAQQPKQPHFKRKPWIHELLSKEITKSPPFMDGVNHVSHMSEKNTLSPPALLPSLPPLSSSSSQTSISYQQAQQQQPQLQLIEKQHIQSQPPIQMYQQTTSTVVPTQTSVTQGFQPMITTQTPTKTTTLVLMSSTASQSSPPRTPPSPNSTTTTTSTSTTTTTTMIPKQSPTYIHSTYPSKTTNVYFTRKTTQPPKRIQYSTRKTITTPSNDLTTDALFSHYKQPEKPLRGPLYLIIEGHSKVKNYGLKDNNTKETHEPKIVPIEVYDQDAVVKKHVVLKDENGQEIEIKHLHNKKSETKKSEEIKSSTLDNNHIEANETKPQEMSLLSLLDSSLAGLFGNNHDVIDKDRKNETRIENNSNEHSSTIFVTTQLPPKNETTIATKTTVLKPIDAALIKESKETRQVFDYDELQRPASIFDFFNTGEEYNDYEDEMSKNSAPTNLNEREIFISNSRETSNGRKWN